MLEIVKKFAQLWSKLHFTIVLRFSHCISVLKGFVWKISTKPYISIFLLFNILLGVLVWLCSCLILLSGDVEVNPGPKNSVSECLSTCHWNLNDISAKTITNYFIWRHIYRFSNWYYLFLRNISQFYCYPWWWELSNFRI